MHFLLFIVGLAVGSFLNVLAFRYDPREFLFRKKSIGGRSHCPHCRHELTWYELVPVFSFLLQRGRCRSCKARLSFQYPIIEVLAGFIAVFVPLRAAILFPFLSPLQLFLFSVSWVIAFLALLLMAVIDWRLKIIPDEIHAILFGVAFILAIIPFSFGIMGGSFLGAYGLLFVVSAEPWMNKISGFLLGGLGMGGVWAITRGRGMGMGDVKLAAALGALFGWPDILILLGMSFVLGACAGLLALAVGGKTLKSALAFGPFLAVAAAIMFFGGYEFIGWYLNTALSL